MVDSLPAKLAVSFVPALRTRGSLTQWCQVGAERGSSPPVGTGSPRAAAGRLLSSVGPGMTLCQHWRMGGLSASLHVLAGKLGAGLENPDFKLHQSTLLERLNFSNDRALGCHCQYHSVVPGREASDFWEGGERPCGGTQHLQFLLDTQVGDPVLSRERLPKATPSPGWTIYGTAQEVTLGEGRQ